MHCTVWSRTLLTQRACLHALLLCRFKSSETAALAYDQAARFVNNKLSEEGTQRLTYKDGKKERQKRPRPLNFPSMCSNDPKIARRLQLIFGAAEAEAAVGCAELAVQDQSDAHSEQHSADHTAGGQSAAGVSSGEESDTATHAAAQQAAAQAHVAAAFSAAQAAPAAAASALSVPAVSADVGPAAAADADIELAASKAALVAAGSPSVVYAVTAAGAGAGMAAGNPSSRSGSCDLPELPASAAHAEGHGAHAGGSKGMHHLQEPQQQLLQESPEDSAGGAVLGEGAGAGASAGSQVTTSEGQRIACSAQQPLLPQQKHMRDAAAQLALLRMPLPQMPSALPAVGSLMPLPLGDDMEDPEWQQLLACVDSGHVAGNLTDMLVGSFAAAPGGAHNTAACADMGVPQGYIAACRDMLSAWQQTLQGVHRQANGTMHTSAPSGGSPAQGWGAVQGSGSSSQAHAGGPVPPAAINPVQAGAEHAGMGPFSSQSGAHAAVAALAPVAGPMAPAAGLCGTDGAAVSGQPAVWVPTSACAAAPRQVGTPAAVTSLGPVHVAHQRLSPAGPVSSAEPVTSAAAGVGAGRVGVLSCIKNPSQALAIVSRFLQCLEDLSLHLQYNQQEQYSSTAVGCATLLSSISNWLQAAWYMDVLTSGALSAAALPGATAAAVAAAKAAVPDPHKPDRAALLLLEQVLTVCADTLTTGYAHWGGAAGGAATAGAFVLQVLQELQQGLAELQRSAAMTSAGAAFDCAQQLQAYLAARFPPQGSEGSTAVSSTLWRLLHVL